MTRQYAIDKAKLFYRENNASYYVVHRGAEEYEVLDEQEMAKLENDPSFRRDMIIFNIIADKDEA